MSHFLSRLNCTPKSGQVFRLGTEEYVLNTEIGDGAVGLVYQTTRLRDNTEWAVKFLAPDPKYIEEEVFEDVAERFKREGERGAKLEHPHLVRVHNYCENLDGAAFVGEGPKNPFIVMEYVQGRSLENYIRKLPDCEHGHFVITKDKLIIAIQIMRAIEHLHSKKIVHRDIKPANIFVNRSNNGDIPRQTKVGDFGIVKWGDFHSSLATGVLTATNQQGLGTLKYMSPEQALAPKKVSVKSDIYSLGISLFELFSAKIMASPHHVFGVMSARLMRGSTVGRFAELDCKLSIEDAEIGEVILDMHLRGIDGRPKIQKIRALFDWEFEKRGGKRLSEN